MAEARDFKFGLQVDHSKSSLQMTNCPCKGHGQWSHHMTNFKFLVFLKYLEQLKLVHWLAM